ncbi:glycoside hydrolase family 28 protein [uncultured Acetobacteroides sp.]|uniref:glycoside hydrolase family 28 protein n=1 Tax=uncultured Acetobacteroides sp. TaxID=1760811 RepID=UPI0029F45F9F|nr:glycoside hydrolase family 28 protein [uncultured Acetobacteroides sp.]
MVKHTVRVLGCTVAIVMLLGFTKNTAKPDPWLYKETILKHIVEPTFRNKQYSILDYGAKAGMDFNSALAINKAIEACANEGGGTVVVPAGTFFTGPIELKSNVNLHVSEGAILRFSTNPKDYTPFVLTRWEGIDCYNYKPLIYAYNQKNIAISGKGTLDGMANEQNWWPWKGRPEYGWKEGMSSQEHNSEGKNKLVMMESNRTPIAQRIMKETDLLRPQFINIYRCERVLIEGVKITNSPFWLIHPLMCNNLIVRGITAESNGPNNDGCDPESCKNVLIEDCFFNTGDDCIAIKSGRNNDGRKWNIPSENILIRHCTMKNGHGGVVIGSEVSGSCRNVFAEDCVMDSPLLERVVRIKSNSFRGGVIENIFVRNIKVGECSEAVLRIELNYEVKNGEKGGHNPAVHNINLDKITCLKSRYGIFIDGLNRDDQVSGISLSNCDFQQVSEGNLMTGVKGVTLKNVKIKGEVLKETPSTLKHK